MPTRCSFGDDPRKRHLAGRVRAKRNSREAEREPRRDTKAGPGGASEIEDEREGIVDGLLLRGVQPTFKAFKAFNTNCAELLDQHARAFSAERDLGPECRRPHAA